MTVKENEYGKKKEADNFFVYDWNLVKDNFLFYLTFIELVTRINIDKGFESVK